MYVKQLYNSPPIQRGNNIHYNGCVHRGKLINKLWPILTATIMIRLSRKPKPMKGRALWTATGSIKYNQ